MLRVGENSGCLPFQVEEASEIRELLYKRVVPQVFRAGPLSLALKQADSA